MGLIVAVEVETRGNTQRGTITALQFGMVREGVSTTASQFPLERLFDRSCVYVEVS